MNFRDNMASLRALSAEHYQNKVSFSNYREQRTELLKLIERDLNGIEVEIENTEITEIVEETLINKALSFFKDR